MSDEQERIERMLADGKISPEEAERLRRALEESEIGETPEVERIEPPRLSRLALAGALCLPGALVAQLLIAALPKPRGAETWSVGPLVLLTGIVLSIAALITIRESHGQLTGRGLALFALILQSILLVLTVS